MKKIKQIQTFLLFVFFFCTFFYFNETELSARTKTGEANSPSVVIQQVCMDANNISSWFINTGIFNQDLRTSNTPGFMWPKGTGKFAIFTSGLCIAAYVNNQLRESMASYKGEYAPGYVVDSAGVPVAKTNSWFKIYSVRSTDNESVPDWANWGQMVPYGAPFKDINQNGTYEPSIDKPGIDGAAQTIFVCLTDGFPGEHKPNEGFGGGTPPLYNEIHMTAWAYTTPGLEDVQFVKWVVINRSHNSWNKTYFTLFNDGDLGYPIDDYIGCDTSLQLGITYNGENMDGTGQGVSYGLDPPAVGIEFLSTPFNHNINPPHTVGMTSCVYVNNASIPIPLCEKDPLGDPPGAYNFMKGVKKDATPWVIPPGGNASYVRKFTYTGNVETGQGWTEGSPGGDIVGSVQNCGGPGIFTGNIIVVNPFGDRRILLSSGEENLTVNPGDTQTIAIGQMVARGSNNLNSVTHLKTLAYFVKNFYINLFGIKQISSEIPVSYSLFQNYPNPFNPSTKIKFEIPLSTGAPAGRGMSVRLMVYDILGREVTTLVNDQLNPGTYEVEFDGTDYPSGIYFYKLITPDHSEAMRMVLLK
jgi:hypothetical protein